MDLLNYIKGLDLFVIISIALVILIAIHLVQLFYCPVTNKFKNNLKDKSHKIVWLQLEAEKEPDFEKSIIYTQKAEELKLDVSYATGMQAKIVNDDELKPCKPIKASRSIDEGAYELMRKLSEPGHNVVKLNIAREVQKNQLKDKDVI